MTAADADHAEPPYTLHHGDCLEVMRSLPDNSVDSVVTDPPYELSNDGKQSASRVFFEFAFPQNAHIKTHVGSGNELALFIGEVLDLGRRRAIPRPAASVPIVPVTLDNDAALGEQDIEHTPESSIGVSADGAISDVEAETSKHLGCFHLKLANSSKLFQVLNDVGTGFIPGGVGIGLAGFSASLPCFQASRSPIGIAHQNVRDDDDTLANLVGALTGTATGPVFGFDLRGGSVEEFTADGARLFAAILLSGAEFVRANPAAGSLPPVFQPRRIGVIDDFANRAFTFDLIFHAQHIIQWIYG